MVPTGGLVPNGLLRDGISQRSILTNEATMSDQNITALPASIPARTNLPRTVKKVGLPTVSIFPYPLNVVDLDIPQLPS